MNKSAYQQEPPFACQIELTEGCPLRCPMCGIQGIRDKPGDYKFMTPAIATKIATDVAKADWHARLEFAMHGEPSISPYRDEIIGIFRAQLPNNQIMMTSNGAGFAKDPAKQIAGLFKAGVNILALDDYQGVPFVPKIREALGVGRYVDYPKDGLENSPHRRWPVDTHRVIIIEDINAASSGSHSHIVNHCGAGAPPNNN